MVILFCKDHTNTTVTNNNLTTDRDDVLDETTTPSNVEDDQNIEKKNDEAVTIQNLSTDTSNINQKKIALKSRYIKSFFVFVGQSLTIFIFERWKFFKEEKTC
jgi:hypothetical protein